MTIPLFMYDVHLGSDWDATFAQLASWGINIAHFVDPGYGKQSQSWYEKLYSTAHRHGVKVCPWASWDTIESGHIEWAANQPALWGWHSLEEPNIPDWYTPDLQIRKYKAIKQRDPNHPVLGIYGLGDIYRNFTPEAMDLVAGDIYPWKWYPANPIGGMESRLKSLSWYNALRSLNKPYMPVIQAFGTVGGHLREQVKYFEALVPTLGGIGYFNHGGVRSAGLGAEVTNLNAEYGGVPSAPPIPPVPPSPVEPGKFGPDILIGGTASASRYWAGYEPSKAFDNNPATWWYHGLRSSIVPIWIKYDLGAGNTRIVNQYTVQAKNGANPTYPKDFKLQGSNNDSDWTDLDTRSNQTFTRAQKRTYNDFTEGLNTTAYRYYRLYITATDGFYPNTRIDIGEIEMMEQTAPLPVYTKKVITCTCGAKIAYRVSSIASENISLSCPYCNRSLGVKGIKTSITITNIDELARLQSQYEIDQRQKELDQLSAQLEEINAEIAQIERYREKAIEEANEAEVARLDALKKKREAELETIQAKGEAETATITKLQEERTTLAEPFYEGETKEPLESLPTTVAERIVSAEPEAVLAEAPPEEKKWPRWVPWVAVIGGAVLLVYTIGKIWEE